MLWFKRITHYNSGALFLGALFFGNLAAVFLFPDFSVASMPEALYQQALLTAQNKVARQNQSRSGALSSNLAKMLFGRYYQVGDHWDVLSWQFDHSLTPLKRSPDKSSSREFQVGTSGLFHYEVLELKHGVSPSVVVRVTQKSGLGRTPVDPRVSYLNLTFTDQLAQAEKKYFFNGVDEGVRVFPDGIRSRISPLELFPLDVPDVVSAEKTTAIALPALPAKVLAWANQIHFKPDLAKSFWFEQDDFFGRPIQVLWQQGDPWPSYIRTAGGITLLINKGAL